MVIVELVSATALTSFSRLSVHPLPVSVGNCSQGIFVGDDVHSQVNSLVLMSGAFIIRVWNPISDFGDLGFFFFFC